MNGNSVSWKNSDESPVPILPQKDWPNLSVEFFESQLGFVASCVPNTAVIVHMSMQV
jgi:hypothetical protein